MNVDIIPSSSVISASVKPSPSVSQPTVPAKKFAGRIDDGEPNFPVDSDKSTLCYPHDTDFGKQK